MIRTAIYGGAFDPPHEEHLQIAAAAARELGLTRVIFMPTGQSPHKKNDAPFEARVEMLRELTTPSAYGVHPSPEGNFFTVSEWENTRPAPHYTYAAIAEWKKMFGEFYLLIGGDSLRDFHKWKKFHEILKSVPLLVAKRADIEGVSWEGADVTFLKYAPVAISSTEIKTHIRLFDEKPEGISDKVYEIIKKRGLYREFDGYTAKLKGGISEEKFLHSLQVAAYAVKLNAKLCLPYEEVFLAGLLHDCKKNVVYCREEIDPRAVGTAVEHQFAGAIAAKREYGIENEKILEAIKCHCTGKPAMNTLEKLIYAADKLEPNRTYKSAENLRKLAETDFEAGFLAVLADQRRVIKEKNMGNLYPLSEETYNFYL